MQVSRLRRTRILAVTAAAGSALALAGVAQTAAAAPARHVLPGSVPNWVHHARSVGHPASGSRVSFGVLLGLRNASDAAAQIQALSDPSSSAYGRWLTNAQFDARYAPAASDVKSVQSWLRSQGFTIATTLRSGMLVEASGTAAQVEKAFATTLANYRLQGKTVRSNSTALSLPAGASAAVRTAVSGVVGIDQGSELKQPADTLPGPPAGSRFGVSPCSSYYGQKVATDKPKAYGKHQPYAVCGYTPDQYQSAYGESSLIRRGITGKGVTVAITDAYAAPTIYQDAQKYNAVHHQPQFTSGQFRQITPGPDGYANVDECGGNGWYGEETLDVEAVHAMAPGAKVVYVAGSDCLSGLDDAWAATIDNHVADIVTNSWTDGLDDLADLGQDYIDFYQQFSTEAALTGVTVNFSSGDDGDHTAGGTDLAAKTAEFPADLPYVTGVGGTSVEIGSRGQWLGEYGWQSSYSGLTDGAWAPNPPGAYSSGGGGGTSQLFAQPFYQRGVVPSSMSKYYGGAAMRVVPDIAMPADPNTGMIVGETQTFPDGTYWDQYRIGGTSLASPLEAGVLAVAQQYSRHPLGFVNPLYYALVRTPGLHDLVAPKQPVAQVRTNFANSVDNSQGKTFQLQTIDVQSTTLHDVRGYDDESGVGTPNGPAFFQGLALLAAWNGRGHR
jgi:subtilase family serine protease